MKLARKVRFARLLRDLSQHQLAERAGVSVSTVVRVEGEKGPMPREQTLRALADALEVDLGWLTDETQDLAALLREGSGQAAQPTEAVAPAGTIQEERRRRNGEVRDLLRRAIRAIEEGARRPFLTPVAPPEEAPVKVEGTAGLRMAPVFDIGADFDRDWHDGDFPVGHSHDQLPAFNGDPSGFWCILRGDSMEPELYAGDLLYFSPEFTRPGDGDICLVRTREFATVKRFFKIGPTTARLAASNPRYPDRIVDLVEDVVQLHKALCFVRMLD